MSRTLAGNLTGRAARDEYGETYASVSSMRRRATREGKASNG